MSVLVCGSLAYDTLLHFDGAFSDHLLPDQLHKLSVCFKVPRLRREFGGCAGNIVYNLRALGGHPCLLASVGEDFAPYQAHLDALGVDSRLVRTVPGQYTAQCFITSDQADNQITAFHPGAMDNPPAAHPSAAGPLQLAILAPGGPQSTLQLADELSALGVPFMFDPGQELPLFSVEQLHALIARARWLALNDYESELLMQRTGPRRPESSASESRRNWRAVLSWRTASAIAASGGRRRGTKCATGIRCSWPAHYRPRIHRCPPRAGCTSGAGADPVRDAL